MKPNLLAMIVAVIGIGAAASAQIRPRSDAAPSFHRDVLPIFQTACVGCHGVDNPASGLSLTSLMTLRKGGKGGQEIIAGKGADSRLTKYLLGTLQPKMPPGAGLKPADIDHIRAWIDAGAKDDAPLPDLPVKSRSGSRTADKTAISAARPSASSVASTMPMLSVPMPVTALAFSPDGTTIAAGLYRQVQFWDVASRRRVRTWSGLADTVHTLVYSRDGKWLAAGGGTSGASGEVRLWDVANGRETRILGEHTDAVNSVAFSPDGARIASGSADKSIKVWETATGKCLATLKEHSDSVTGVAWSADGKYLVSGSADWSVKVWDAAGYRRLYSLGAHEGSVSDVEFSADGKSLITAGADHAAKTWNFGPESSVLAHGLFGHNQAVLAATFAPNGKLAATSAADKWVKIWNPADGAGLSTLQDAKDWVYVVRFSPDSKHLAAGVWDGSILLWSMPEGKLEATLQTFNGPSGDGAHLPTPTAKTAKLGISGAAVPAGAAPMDKHK